MEQGNANYHRGEKLDSLRKNHLLFIEKHLVFGDGLEIAKNKVSSRYDKWIKMVENRNESWGSSDVANIYKLLELEYGVKVTADKLIGVKLKKK